MKCTVQCVFTTVYTNISTTPIRSQNIFYPQEVPHASWCLYRNALILTLMGFYSFFFLILTKCPDNAQHHLDL